MLNVNQYEVYLRVTVLGETETDALETLFDAVDQSNLLNEDGVVSIQVLSDTVEQLDSFNDEDDDE
jgi:hypothetical protein